MRDLEDFDDDFDLEDTCDDDDLPDDRALARLRAFGDQTLITTERGPIPAKDLTAADRVRARTGEYVGIDWVEKMTLGPDFFEYHPDLRPVLLCEGDLGDGPRRNVVLSPEQMIWRERDGAGEFRRAGDLSPYANLFRKRMPAVTYVAFQCTKPTVIDADGLWVSLMP